MHTHRIVAAAALATLTCGAPAFAGTLFSEDFSGATPGDYGAGPIPGTQFDVTADNVDIIGVLNGSFYTCVDNSTGNCLDLVGNSGGGAITSMPTFTLAAGETYTVKFGAVLQGYAPGMGSTTFAVGLGSMSQTETIDGTTQQFSLTFKPLVAESNAALAFTTVIPGDGSHGAVLDNISLTSAAGAAPEPASWALMLVGFGAAGAAMRSRRRGLGAV
jgi:hypothetical protein